MARQWAVTADKFISSDKLNELITFLTRERDLAIIRAGSSQPIRDYYLFRILIETGVRVFECTNLNNQDVSNLTITVKRGKGGKPRTILITRKAGKILNEWSEVKRDLGLPDSPSDPMFPSRFGRPYTTRGIQKRIKMIFRAVGLPANLSVHSIRHTYCSLLLKAGVPLPTVRNNMGHSSLAITNIYSHSVSDSLGDLELRKRSVIPNFAPPPTPARTPS